MAAPAPRPSEWRIQTAIVMQRADRQVLAQLRAAEKALTSQLFALARRPGFSNRVRMAQLNLAKREVQRSIADTFRRIGDITAARRLDAAARVIDLNKQTDTLKLLGAGLPDGAELAQAIADAELDAAKSGVDRMMARVQGSSYTTLSQRVYVASSGLNGPVSTLVNGALARSLSAKEFAKEVAGFINPNTPGGVKYASMRLARTEINNAAHAVAVHSVQDKPWVDSMKWHLSGSHPKPDLCNDYASGGPKGDGVYPKSEVPAKPHPHCFCFVVPELPDDEEFLNSLVAGKYNSYLDKYRNIRPGEVIRSDGFGTGVIRPTGRPPAAPKDLPARPAPPVPPSPPATPPAPPPPAAKVFKEGIENIIQTMIRNERSTDDMIKALQFFEKDAAKARALIESVRSVTDVEAWIGTIDKSVTGVMRESVDKALKANHDLVGGKLNRLNNITMHKPGGTYHGAKEVDKAMQSAYACQFQGQVYLARDLADRMASLLRSQRSGWFAPTSPEVNQFVRTTSHEIGHALTVGYVRGGQIDEFLARLSGHLRLPQPAGINDLFDEAGWKAWMKMKTLDGKSTVSKVLQKEFGVYSVHLMPELLAEIWAPYSLDSHPTAAIKFAGDLLRKLIREGHL